MNPRQRFGKWGEDQAAGALEQKGYRILCRNYRSPYGEIDIVATHADTLVFVEVKSRRTQTFGHPRHAVTPRKQARMSKTALHYLKMAGHQRVRARFDVVTLIDRPDSLEVEIIQNAFEFVPP